MVNIIKHIYPNVAHRVYVSIVTGSFVFVYNSVPISKYFDISVADDLFEIAPQRSAWVT